MLPLQAARLLSPCILSGGCKRLLPKIQLQGLPRRLMIRMASDRSSRMTVSSRADAPRLRISAAKMIRKAGAAKPGPFGATKQRNTGRLKGPIPRPNLKLRQKLESHPTRGHRPRQPSPGQGRSPPKWEMRALKMQQALSEIPYPRRAKIKEAIKAIDSFNQFDILPSVQKAIVQDALKGMQDIVPSPIQRLAIPALLGQSIGPFIRTTEDGFQSFLLAAETGSGKTLAYLIPSINAMKRAEASDQAVIAWTKRQAEARKRESDPKYRGPRFDEPHPNMARPKIIVLVPTAELAAQVGAVAKMLSHETKFISEVLSADMKAHIIHRNVFSPMGVDLITTTPHLLASIAESDPNVLSRVTHLVIDEADSLLDRSFSPVTTRILDRSAPSLKQLILCSATVPRRLDKMLFERFPAMNRLTTPNLHAIPRRMQMGVIDVGKDPYHNNKLLACHDALWTISKELVGADYRTKDMTPLRRVLVFVNERSTTQVVANYLASTGISVVALHRDTPEARQQKALKIFTENHREMVSTPQVRQHRGLKNLEVLVATDIAARGIDTLAVRHVVLYDVPHSTIDFIHRLGRACRMGRRGRAIILVSNQDRKDVVAEVKKSMFMGHALI